MLEKHRDLPKLNFNQIIDHIYVGTNMCCQTHFRKELLDQGILADFSLEEERLDAPFGVKFFFWLPTKDHTPPTQTQFQMGVDILKKCAELDLKVYVHCKNGHGRAPTMVAAYLISQGKTVKEALELIREKRSVIHLENSQVEALEEFAVNF